MLSWIFCAAITASAPPTPATGHFLSSEEQSRATWIETPVERNVGASSLTYTIRGGASLGNYEAGYTWALLRALRNRRGELAMTPARISAFTGASAGAINAILGAESWLQRNDEPLDDNGLWNIWVNVGIDQLVPDMSDPGAYEKTLAAYDELSHLDVPRDDVSARWSREQRMFGGDDNGLFSRRAFDRAKAQLAGRLASHAYEKLAPVHVGVVFTNARGELLPGEVRAATQRAFAAVTLSANDSGELDIVDATCASQTPSMGLRLRFDTKPMKARLFDLASASSAFPLVFSPVCLGGQDADGTCTGPLFLDGAVFDNEPTRLARQLSSCTEAPGIAMALDPNVPNQDTADVARLVGVEQLAAIISEAVTTSVNAELFGADDLSHDVMAMMRKVRVFGSGASNFAGFYARVFRRYDYYAGVYDAARTLTRDRCTSEHGVFWRDDRPSDCPATTMRALYEALALPASPDAAYVFNLLWTHDDELHAGQTAENLGNLPTHSVIIEAVATALAAPRTTARAVPFATATLAADGVLEQLEALRALPAFAAIAASHDIESRELTELVEQTDRWSRERMTRLLARLYYVEHQHRVRTGAEAASTGETLADVGQFFVEQQKPWSGVALRMNNTIPDYTSHPGAEWALRLIPNVIDFDLKNGGGSLRYNFLLGFGEHLALTAPVTPLVWQSNHVDGGWREFGTVGLGGHYRFNTIALSSIEALANFMVWDHDAHPDSTSQRWSAELGTYLFVSKLHIAVEYGTGPAFSQSGLGLGRSFNVKVGVSDLPGLTYWVSRLISTQR